MRPLLRLDVTDGAGCSAAVAASAARFGDLDVMGPKHLLNRLGRPGEIARARLPGERRLELHDR